MANSSGNGLEQIQNLDNLKACGFSDEQSRGILKAMSKNVATKSDVEITKLELKRDIEEVRREISETKSELKRDIEKVRVDLSKDIEKVRADLFIKIEQVKGELNKDLTQRMFYFFLATVTILGSLMAWMKFLVPVIVQN